MKKLSYQTLKELNYDGYLLESAPERVLQLGEGNFLRAFVDYFIDKMNEMAGFNSKVVVCQPQGSPLADIINEQEGLYTLFLRGFQDGQKINKKRVISCISRCLNPRKEFDAVLPTLPTRSSGLSSAIQQKPELPMIRAASLRTVRQVPIRES